MKFNLPSEIIPHAKRKEINSKILLLIESGKASNLPMDAIFNAYTGDGGLHGLELDDYNSFHGYSKAKREIENGQFFTPASLAKEIVSLVPLTITDLVADLTCGMGTFFNFMPVEANCYGCELDVNATKVARYLFPSANIEMQDIRHYKPNIQFDFLFGNPPFHLEWKVQGKSVLSESYFMEKSFELLAPGGLLLMIAPASFLSDDFMAKHMIANVDEWFGFLGQCKIPSNAFAHLGVQSYATKLLIFQKRFDGIPARTYNTKEFIAFDSVSIRERIIVPALQHKKARANEIKLSLAVGENDWSFKSSQRKSDGYRFRVKKYLYEIRAHVALKSKLGKALAYLHRFETQTKPDDMNHDEWVKVRLTEEKVLAYLRQMVASQWRKRKEGYSIFNTAQGITIKSHEGIISKRFAEKGIRNLSWREIIDSPKVLSNHLLASELKKFEKLARSKRAFYNRNMLSFDLLSSQDKIDNFLTNYSFVTPEGIIASLTSIQFNDLGKVLQKNYGILAWQQGSGKTVASWCAMLYRQQHNNIHNCFIISSPLAVGGTWIPYLDRQKANYVVIEQAADFKLIRRGQVVVCTLTMLSKYQRDFKIFLKSISQNGFLVFDESDEITNYTRKRSQATRNVFRKLKYKLLTTGTTTRNNIGELYGQLELLYNNSNLFVCDCRLVYHEQNIKDWNGISKREIMSRVNNDFDMPFPARGGVQLFKSCYAPVKSTVFGIKKHNQDVYNADSLTDILKRTVITRKFNEIAGEGRYEIHTHCLTSKPYEQMLYYRILEELNSMLPLFYSSTGNHRKDAMLRIIRQLQLLIKSCSIPHIMEKVDDAPAKAGYIKRMVKEYSDEKVMIGTTTIAAATYYAAFLRKEVGMQREVYLVTGSTHDVPGRQWVVDIFQHQHNAILVCTQQSLSASINIPTCSRVLLESMQWNIPRMEQFYFRCIRFDSVRKTNVHFILYENSIEVNLMALLTSKERLNDFIKTLELRDHEEVMGDFGLNENFLDFLLEKVADENGKIKVSWGKQMVRE